MTDTTTTPEAATVDYSTLTPRDALRTMYANGVALVEGDFDRLSAFVQAESDAAQSEEISAGQRAAEADFDTCILVTLFHGNGAKTDSDIAQAFAWVVPSVKALTTDKSGATVGSRIYGLKLRRSAVLVTDNGAPGIRISEAWRTVGEDIKNGGDKGKAAKAEAESLGQSAQVSESTVRAVRSMASDGGALARLIDSDPSILAALGADRLAKAAKAAKPEGNGGTPRQTVAPADALQEAAKAYGAACARLLKASQAYTVGPLTAETVTALNDGSKAMKATFPLLRGRSTVANAGQAAKATTGAKSADAQPGTVAKPRKPRTGQTARSGKVGGAAKADAKA